MSREEMARLGVRARYRHWLFRLPLLRHYSAICLGRCIYFKGSEEEVAARPTLLRHELVHQRQIAANGRVRFYVIYLRDYLLNLYRYRDHWQAYRNIPFEKEAYESETLQA